MPLIFNIAPFSPGHEAETAADMVEYAERTGNDTVLYCLSFHAEGRPALAKTERLLDSYRPLKQLQYRLEPGPHGSHTIRLKKFDWDGYRMELKKAKVPLK